MSRRIFNSLLAAAVMFMSIGSADALAQAYGSFTPYSIFGVGDLSHQGTAYNKTMGGVGIASRNHRFVNIMNPAAVTARDSLAFMADFSVYSDNKIFKQNDLTSGSNTFNINDLVMSFPIYRSSAMMLGILPYSNSGFGYTYEYTDPDIIGRTGNISYDASGSGSIYKGFAAVGVTFLKRLSVGAEMDYYFGSLTKNYVATFSDASHNGISNETDLQLSAFGGKFGVQYEQPLGKQTHLTIGATYSTKANIKGYLTDERFVGNTSAQDTLYYKNDTLGRGNNPHIAGEIGVGVALTYKDKLRLEFDYTNSDWGDSKIGGVSGFGGSSSPFVVTTSESYRFGMEIVPNRNDIRYYRNRVAYRAGAYYRKEYYTLSGNEIASKGITLGATLPIYRWYNGLTLGVDLGQRGSLSGDLVRERYVNFSVGINIFDIWFQKSRYD